MAKSISNISSSKISPKSHMTVHGGKVNIETVQRLLDPGSEMMQIPRNPKCHCDPPVKVGA